MISGSKHTRVPLHRPMQPRMHSCGGNAHAGQRPRRDTPLCGMDVPHAAGWVWCMRSAAQNATFPMLHVETAAPDCIRNYVPCHVPRCVPPVLCLPAQALAGLPAAVQALLRRSLHRELVHVDVGVGMQVARTALALQCMVGEGGVSMRQWRSPLLCVAHMGGPKEPTWPAAARPSQVRHRRCAPQLSMPAPPLAGSVVNAGTRQHGTGVCCKVLRRSIPGWASSTALVC